MILPAGMVPSGSVRLTLHYNINDCIARKSMFGSIIHWSCCPGLTEATVRLGQHTVTSWEMVFMIHRNTQLSFSERQWNSLVAFLPRIMNQST
eukprot:1065023-Amphidinium_carterae.1